MKKVIMTLLILSLISSGFIILKNNVTNIKVYSSPTLMKENFIGTVIATKLNLRQGPCLNAEIISVLDVGEELNIYAKIDNWYLVFHPIKEYAGMVHKNYIKKQEANLKTEKNIDHKQSDSSDTTNQSYNDSSKSKTQSPSINLPILPKIQPSEEKIEPTSDEKKVLELVNLERKKLGLSLLQFDDKLLHCARLKSRDIIQKNYFSHQSPTYGSPFDMLRQFQVDFKSAGENIAGNPNLQNAVLDWMASDSHRDNILNPNFKYVGIGVENSPVYGNIIVKQLIS